MAKRAKRKLKKIPVWDRYWCFDNSDADVRYTSCCGVWELADCLDRGPREVLATLAACERKEDNRKPIVFFTDAIRYKNGTKLAAYIRKNRLGSLVSTKGQPHNENSGNSVRAWLWTINRPAFKKWCDKNIEWDGSDAEDTEDERLPDSGSSNVSRDDSGFYGTWSSNW